MKQALAFTLLLGLAMGLKARDFERNQGIQWAPFVEWTLENQTVDDNPFDLEAKVTFVHQETKRSIQTGMFYVGGHQWKIRFCGTLPGLWEWSSSSSDPDLNGHTGSVWIEPSHHTNGFVTGIGQKWARQTGRNGTPKAFIPQFVMYRHPKAIADHFDLLKGDIETFIHEHGFTGFHVPVYCRWFDLDEERSSNVDTNDPNPDLNTFAVLEKLITQVHAAGGMVHYWAWGDESRHQTPVKWGINGKADQRLQRYIAARLGPLPGWTMGYGFDLDEWVTEHQLKTWRDFMHDQMGWPHLLGGRHGEPNQGTDHSMARSWNQGMDYASYEHHRPTPEVYRAALNTIPTQPVFSEDRFRIRQSKQYRQKDYDEHMTRRGLWQSAMSGGVANIWGRLEENPEINQGFGASDPYPHPEWIKTWSIFFAKFFANDAEPKQPDHSLQLVSQVNHRRIIYAEETNKVSLGPSPNSPILRTIAIDTLKPYAELEIQPGTTEDGNLAWKSPYKSDWALVSEPLTLPYPKSSLMKGINLDWPTHRRSAPGSDNFQLTWADDDHLYGAWGDGGGFGGTNRKGRVGLGVARIQGGANNYEGTNIWGGHQAANQATFDGKSWGIISVQDKIHMWVVPDKPNGKIYRNHYEYIELATSVDHGATWQKAPWRFETNDQLTIPTFLNFGQNNEGVPEAFGDYVYTYFIEPQSPGIEQMGPKAQQLIIHQPGRLYLARIHQDDLDQGKSAFYFYTGINSDAYPRWGTVKEKQPVFEDANGAGWCVSASYHPGLNRILLATQHSQNAQGRLGIFDAPTPWGPWTTVEYFDAQNPFGADRPGSKLSWENNVFFVSFVSKWFDGDTFTLAFTGAGRGRNNDSFNTVKGRFLRFN